jgi:hypothetical protein
VVGDERQQHRIIACHASLFARLSLRGRSARAWLRRPVRGPEGLLLYVPMTDESVGSLRRASRVQRIRLSASKATSGHEAAQMSSVTGSSPP